MKYAIATLIFAALMALFLIVALTVGDANAAEICSYISKPYRSNWTGDVVYRRVYSCRPERHYYAAPRRDYDEERWEGRDAREDRGVECKRDLVHGGPLFVQVVGDAKLNQENALKSAVDQWKKQIRFDHGERFMEIENARHYRWRCNLASTNESTVGKIGEAFVGDAATQKRCTVVAQPCVLPMIRGDKDER